MKVTPAFLWYGLCVVLLLPCRGHAQSLEAELVGVGAGDVFYSRYYNSPVFGGIIQMSLEGRLIETYCIDMYIAIELGDVLFVNGPLTDLSDDVDWCTVNYLLNNFSGTTPLEAGALQAAVWYVVTAPYGVYQDTDERYQFMTDPKDSLPYDGFSFTTGPVLRARAFEMLASVPTDLGSDCIARFPEVIDLQPAVVDVADCGQEDVVLTATVFDQFGEPMPGMTVHMVTEDGELAPAGPGPDAAAHDRTRGARMQELTVGTCRDWVPGIVEWSEVTDAAGQVRVLFSACGPAAIPAVSAWVEGDYGTLLFDPLNQLQPLTTVSLIPFSVSDETYIVCRDRTVPEGATGCSHGYWMNHAAAWRFYGPDDRVADVFSIPPALGLDPDDTLLEALDYRGGRPPVGQARILLMQAVASLLNAVHPDVAFDMTGGQVIALTSDVLATLDAHLYVGLSEMLDEANNSGCGP